MGFFYLQIYVTDTYNSLFGVVCIQAVIYFQSKSKDKPIIRVLVSMLFRHSCLNSRFQCADVALLGHRATVSDAQNSVVAAYVSNFCSVLDAIYQALLMHAGYYYFIINFGDVETMLMSVWWVGVYFAKNYPHLVLCRSMIVRRELLQA